MNYQGAALDSQQVSPRIDLTPRSDGSTLVRVEKPTECAGCGTMRMVFINANGSTLCAAVCSK